MVVVGPVVEAVAPAEVQAVAVEARAVAVEAVAVAVQVAKPEATARRLHPAEMGQCSAVAVGSGSKAASTFASASASSPSVPLNGWGTCRSRRSLALGSSPEGRSPMPGS